MLMNDPIRDLLDLDTYPIDRLDEDAGQALVARCQSDLEQSGMFNLAGLLRPPAIRRAITEVMPLLRAESFTHKRLHNIYFKKDIPGLPPDHPALRQVETINHTICTDQLAGSVVREIYEWPAMGAFLAAVMGKPALYIMADPLAGANVMQYRAGEALNWHFDRSEFTTTLLLQASEQGGEFEYRTDLRTDADPNYDGVAKLLAGKDPQSRILRLAAGTLNVFRGKNTAHRVTPVVGDQDRIIAVLSYYERPGTAFSAEERIGFYGRAG
ncbi:MAG: 2OG-Fe(II) oxygenase [Hyphomicrobiaceae bacterium]